jgi:hypothetical protein
MNPFEAVGEVARWRTVYSLFQASSIGKVIKYETIADALELHHVDDRHAIQMATRRAAKEYLRNDSRAVEAVKNVGYRVVEPEEHLRLAQGQQKKSRKALVRGHDTAVHVDLNGMEPEVRKAFDVTARAFSTLLEYNRRLDTRQKHLESALNAIVNRQDRSEDDITDLKNRLAKLEARRTKLAS